VFSALCAAIVLAGLTGCSPPAEGTDSGAADQAASDAQPKDDGAHSSDGKASDGSTTSDAVAADGEPQPPLTTPKPQTAAGPDLPVGKLIEQLADSATRDSAREALIGKGSAAVDELVKTLDHEDEFVRAAAAFALSEIGDKSALPALEKRSAVEKSDVAGAALLNAIAALKE
jgi:HEAT repeat protein